jgi:uncharacterized protein (TIGR00369 family)
MAAERTLSATEVTDLVDTHFPQVHAGGKILFIEAAGASGARVRMRADAANIRPGGTISGPAMFKLADFAVYVAILARVGTAGLQAVTTNLNINFLSRPGQGDMIANVHLIKLGRRLAVGEVEIFADGRTEVVTHAIGTYAMPPEYLR